MVEGSGGEQSRRVMLVRWDKAAEIWSQWKRQRGQDQAAMQVRKGSGYD
jgi:hypothetical protein